MEKEFLYYESSPLEFPLDESIHVAQSIPHERFIVSNIDIQNTEIFAPEINFYLQNTHESIAQKIVHLHKLYQARLSVYDLAQELDYQQEVGKKVLIVSQEKEGELSEKLGKDGFFCIVLSPKELKDIRGHIGNLSVNTSKIMRNDLMVDQILWHDAPYFAIKQSGVYDPAEIGWVEAVQKVYANSGTHHYKNFVQYDSSVCQYHERTEEICGKCEEVCPSVAIMKIDEEKHLVFSDIDCHGCGGCVSVCPSGALDFTQMPRDAFYEVADYYRGHIALLLPRQVEMPAVSLPEKVLPLALEGRKYLHEVHLLTLLQKSGHAVIFYTDFVSKGTGDAVRIINEIFERKYNKKAIYVCQTAEALQAAMEEATSIEACLFDITEEGMNKREIFTYRLAHLVGEDDLGVIETGEHIHYGNVIINEANCTLCMSCVGACNVAALTSHPEDNTLKFNPSLCTNCGYCEVVCPEKECLEVVYDQLSLHPAYFRKNTMAHDDLFACVECGAEFATVKSVEKIADMMKPIFGDDEVKIRTLCCCADCKPKVMFSAHVEFREQQRLGGKV
jgi:ferredoxin